MADEAVVVGIKETKEFVIGVNELAIALTMQLKDGFQMADLSALFTKLQSDEDFKAKLQAAYEGMNAMGGEFKDISMGEGIELALVQIQYLPKILAAAKV